MADPLDLDAILLKESVTADEVALVRRVRELEAQLRAAPNAAGTRGNDRNA